MNKNKLKYGVGINDADYQVSDKKLNWKCPFYVVWSNMLTRCYSKSYQEAHPSYQECSVCGDWLVFSKFRMWMEKQDYINKQLDKDILIRNNKIYSPINCCFVDKNLNLFLTENKSSVGDYPVGVDKRANLKSRPYRSSIKNPFTGKRLELGCFNTPEEAHIVWKTKKHEYACIFAERESDLRIKEALKLRYITP
jgi:hypothetical protein